MADERIDIIVTDKVDVTISKRLRTIARAATAADTAVDRLQANLNQVTAGGVVKQQSEAQKAATATQRLANEQVAATRATQKLARAANGGAQATRTQAAATDTLSAAQRANEAAAEAATGANERLNNAAIRAGRGARQQAAQMQNVIYQLNDVAVGLASGQAPMTVMLQQGSQLSTIFGPKAGLTAVLGGVIKAVGQMVKSFAPALIVVGAIAAVTRLLQININKTTDVGVTMGDTLRAAFSLAADAIGSVLMPAIRGVASVIVPVMNTVGSVVRAGVNLIIGYWVGVYRVVQLVWNNIPAAIELALKMSRNIMLSGVQLIANTFIVGTRTMINSVIAAFVGGYNAVVVAWDDLPTAFHNLGVLAMNGLISVVEGGVRGILAAIDGLLTFIGKAAELVGQDNPFADLIDPKKIINLDQFKGELTETGKDMAGRIAGGFTDAFSKDYTNGVLETIDLGQFKAVLSEDAANLGSGIAGAFKDSLSIDYVGTAFDILRDRAIEISVARQTKEAQKFVKAVDESTAGLRSQAAGLRASIGVYDDYGRAVAVATKIAELRQKALNDKLALTPILLAEISRAANQYGDAVQELNKTRDLVGIIDEARSRVDDYKRTVDSLTEALRLGAITQAQFNGAINNTGVVQDLNAVGQDLTGLGGMPTDISQSAQIEALRSQEADRLAIVQDALDARIISEQQAADYIVAINRKTAQDIQEVENARYSMMLQGAQSTFDSLAQATRAFGGEQSDAYRALFAVSKAFAIAESIIKIQQGAAQALSLPFPINIPAIAAVAAQGASIISNIQSVAQAGFKTGGYTGDMGVNDVAGVVHGREFVFDAAATRRIGPASLDSLRRTGTLPANDNRATQQPVPTRSGPKITLNNYGTNKDFDVQQIGPDEVRIIARDIARDTVKREAGRAVAAELSAPNSRASRAVAANTTARRRR